MLINAGTGINFPMQRKKILYSKSGELGRGKSKSIVYESHKLQNLRRKEKEWLSVCAKNATRMTTRILRQDRLHLSLLLVDLEEGRGMECCCWLETRNCVGTKIGFRKSGSKGIFGVKLNGKRGTSGMSMQIQFFKLEDYIS